MSIDLSKITVTTGPEEIAKKAFTLGHGHGLAASVREFLHCLYSRIDLHTEETVNSGYLIEQVVDLVRRETIFLSQYGSPYEIDTENLELRLVKGRGDLSFSTDGIIDRILEAVSAGETSLEYNRFSGVPRQPDFDSIRSQLINEMANARFAVDGSHAIVPEKSGYTFEVEAARQLWEEALPGGIVRIPLKELLPERTAETMESLLYRDLIGAVTTKYNKSGENRCNNVRLAAEKVNGTVIYPGEVFSFNETVGLRTEEAGFLPAPAYIEYENIQEEIGGGICQVSSGIYAASLFAFLKPVEHSCHIYPTSYMQLGTDSAVTMTETGEGDLDLKITNTRWFPVKIVTYCEETVDEKGKPLKTVTVELWGTVTESDYMPLEFDNSYADIYDYDRVIAPAYPEREGYLIRLTHTEKEFWNRNGKGLRTLTHREVYDSEGNLVDDTVVNLHYGNGDGYAYDTYYYMK